MSPEQPGRGERLRCCVCGTELPIRVGEYRGGVCCSYKCATAARKKPRPETEKKKNDGE